MAERVARAGFYLALALYFYGTLFPFRLDLSTDRLSTAWSQVHFYPFWDPGRGRIHSLPDIVSNIMLSAPIGFFGLLRSGRENRIVHWGVVSFWIGVAAETLQLGIPGRHSLLTDALSAGVGGITGAAMARIWGRRLLEFLAGAGTRPAWTWLLILLSVIAAIKLGPLDLTMDVSSVRADVHHLLHDPWNRNRAPQEEWYTMAAFVLLGALVGATLRTGDRPNGLPRSSAAAALLLLPWGFEFAQFFVESHSPSLLSGALDTIGAAAGLGIGLFAQGWLRPGVGLVIVGAGIAAAGLSPYRFVPWRARTQFGWVPFAEYYRHTNAAALYDAGTGVLMFGLFGALLQQSAGCRPGVAAATAAGFAFLIELAQQLIPTRYPGATDVVIAALGAWLGAAFSYQLSAISLQQKK